MGDLHVLNSQGGDEVEERQLSSAMRSVSFTDDSPPIIHLRRLAGVSRRISFSSVAFYLKWRIGRSGARSLSSFRTG